MLIPTNATLLCHWILPEVEAVFSSGHFLPVNRTLESRRILGNNRAHRDDGKSYVVHADEILTAFLELESTHATQKVRVTGYLMWDDEHNSSSTEVGSTIQRLGRNGLHQRWRSTAWKIHPVMKVEVLK
jgi:hypothetical protein